MVEAVRSRDKIIGINNVNRVLIQPHWRIEKDIEQLLLLNFREWLWETKTWSMLLIS